MERSCFISATKKCLPFSVPLFLFIFVQYKLAKECIHLVESSVFVLNDIGSWMILSRYNSPNFPWCYCWINGTFFGGGAEDGAVLNKSKMIIGVLYALSSVHVGQSIGCVRPTSDFLENDSKLTCLGYTMRKIYKTLIFVTSSVTNKKEVGFTEIIYTWDYLIWEQKNVPSYVRNSHLTFLFSFETYFRNVECISCMHVSQ